MITLFSPDVRERVERNNRELNLRMKEETIARLVQFNRAVSTRPKNNVNH